MRTASLAILAGVLLGACSQNAERGEGPHAEPFQVTSLAKTETGRVLEIHVREVRAHLRDLMEKLYKRNPRELAKSPLPTAQENIVRLFDLEHDWRFPELNDMTSTDAIHLSLSPDYEGDRVFAFMAGMTSMLMKSYEYKTEFYLLDSVDPQYLYNSARNVEIAVWKLKNEMDASGEPYIYSNSRPGEVENLSYERLFGKLISLQDTIAIIIAGKTNRIIRKVVQNVATAMFLPVF